MGGGGPSNGPCSTREYHSLPIFAKPFFQSHIEAVSTSRRFGQRRRSARRMALASRSRPSHTAGNVSRPLRAGPLYSIHAASRSLKATASTAFNSRRSGDAGMGSGSGSRPCSRISAASFNARYSPCFRRVNSRIPQHLERLRPSCHGSGASVFIGCPQSVQNDGRCRVQFRP